jgi:hypothetical protein
MKNRDIITQHIKDGKPGGGCDFDRDSGINTAFMDAAFAVQSDGFDTATVAIPGEGTFTITFQSEAERADYPLTLTYTHWKDGEVTRKVCAVKGSPRVFHDRGTIYELGAFTNSVYNCGRVMGSELRFRTYIHIGSKGHVA